MRRLPDGYEGARLGRGFVMLLRNIHWVGVSLLDALNHHSMVFSTRVRTRPVAVDRSGAVIRRAEAGQMLAALGSV